MPSLLLDARLMLGRPTGIGRYLASLVPELRRQAPELHLHLLRRARPWPGYDVESWLGAGLTHHVSDAPCLDPRQHLWLPRMARRLGVDLLHYPHFDAPVLGRVPVVATLFDVKHLVRPDLFPHSTAPMRLYMRASFALTLARAAAVLPVSHATAADLRRLFPRQRAAVEVTPLAADPQFRRASAGAIARFRERYALPRPFILSVGELRPHKNHAGLVRAYARSRSRASHDLVIVGQPHRGNDEPQREAQDAGLAERIHFLSDVDAAELVAAYSAADLFALVSLYEGFGLPALEAMACGTPVVAARTTALGEVAGEGAWQVDPGDPASIAAALDAIVEDPEQRRLLAERGARRQRAFSWEETARRTLAAYRQVLAGPARTAPRPAP